MSYLNGKKVLLGANVTTINIPVDQTYNPESENAQSGKAVAEALRTVTVGGVEYELINTITVTPDTDGSLPRYVTFTLDKDGTPFELESFYVNIKAGFTDGGSSTLYMSVNGTNVLGNVSVQFKNTELRKTSVHYRQSADGYIDIDLPAGSTTPTEATCWSGQLHVKYGVTIPPQDTKNLKTVTKVTLFTLVGANKTWIDGSKFELWGVRKK